MLPAPRDVADGGELLVGTSLVQVRRAAWLVPVLAT
jgi:hypothetical protein